MLYITTVLGIHKNFAKNLTNKSAKLLKNYRTLLIRVINF